MHHDVFRSTCVRSHLRHGVTSVGRDLPYRRRVPQTHQEGEAAHDEHEFPTKFAKTIGAMDRVLDGNGEEIFVAVPVEAEYAVFVEGGDHSICDRQSVGPKPGVSVCTKGTCFFTV